MTTMLDAFSEITRRSGTNFRPVSTNRLQKLDEPPAWVDLEHVSMK